MPERITSYTANGLRFDVNDSGPLNGDPVVLLHGFPQTARSWDRVSMLLNAARYRTIAPNQRGYSPGARPKGRSAYRLEELVSDVLALIDTLDMGPVHLVGHDWGAAVAWSLAAGYPEHVRTLTSVSVPHPGAFMRSMTTSGQALRSYYMAIFQIPWLPEVLGERSPLFKTMLSRAGMSEQQIREVSDEIVDGGALPYALNWYRALPFSNPKELSRRVRVPTTHVWSTHDVALGRKTAELAGDFVKAPFRLEILDGSHWIPEQQPDELARIIRERIESKD
ncbi:alpha/beta fold hydrolase [Skermania sp. ID1734]|uniref:alpha/beta fold hydrolase n=1 Tax=Skermania sp. ID1734 TaxID=2597516 RepID=UPI00117F554F|nr:alpha/beta fold hydrolase [Skermania sp. ID1734]TSD93950.1 alpha/beta fold hydrolase [Skermania sp. ID1734]